MLLLLKSSRPSPVQLCFCKVQLTWITPNIKEVEKCNKKLFFHREVGLCATSLSDNMEIDLSPVFLCISVGCFSFSIFYFISVCVSLYLSFDNDKKTTSWLWRQCPLPTT